MMSRLLDLIVPTYNNPQFLNPCIDSIEATGILEQDARLIIVNNGIQPIRQEVEAKGLSNVLVIEPGRNLGWEGGLAFALEHSEAPFVCFQNDDTFIPVANRRLYERMLSLFSDDNVAAVGPSTTVAAGLQSAFHPKAPRIPTLVSYLIFFCVMIRRKHLDMAGGVDMTLPGGDDFDLSIRLRKLGLHLVIEPEAFLIHHGFQTGTRVHGDHTKPGGWNSQDMTDRTNKALIQKHGFRTYIETLGGIAVPYETPEVVHA